MFIPTDYTRLYSLFAYRQHMLLLSSGLPTTHAFVMFFPTEYTSIYNLFPL